MVIIPIYAAFCTESTFVYQIFNSPNAVNSDRCSLLKTRSICSQTVVLSDQSSFVFQCTTVLEFNTQTSLLLNKEYISKYSKYSKYIQLSSYAKKMFEHYLHVNWSIFKSHLPSYSIYWEGH